jgi:hypothetical protein
MEIIVRMLSEGKMFSLDNIAKVVGCLAGLATTAALIAAIITLRHTKKIWKKQLEHDRPFFIFEKGSKISKLPEPNWFQMDVLFKNGGVRPAHDVNIATYVLEKSCSGYKTRLRQERSVDVIWPGEAANWSKDIALEPSMPKRYIVLVLEYKDPVTENALAQRVYLKYPRIVKTEKECLVNLNEIERVSSLEEKQEIDYFIRSPESKCIHPLES